MSSNEIVRRIRLGDEVATYCGKCKEERNHQIVALSMGQIERVQCKTCGGNHIYREQSAAKKGRAVRERRATSSSRSAPASSRSYATSEIYNKGDWITHPKFGSGEVVAARNGKIDVKFGTTMRTLLQGIS
jgi:hypothetical protein